MSETCVFYIQRKKRYCKMAAKPGKKFCVEHGVVQTHDTDRTPCPYDPKHTCYIANLHKHLRKCNSRPKQLPDYIAPGVNSQDAPDALQHNPLISISSVPDNTLITLLRKVEKVFAEDGIQCTRRVLTHPVLDTALANSLLGMNTKKHLIQNSSLLKNMEEYGFFGVGASFVEFGAGRGHLGFWISQAVEEEGNCSLLLIDRASHRHKSDNKLKGVSPVRTLRIRADIADVDLSRVSFLSGASEVYGVTKHLCGAATDLALRCIVRGKSNGVRVKGVAMALCCHHRCTWNSFVGKKYLMEKGFEAREFSVLCSMSSWAICGSGRPRSRGKMEEEEEEEEEEEGKSGDRYKQLGISREEREEIGRKCKMILNEGRLKYLKEFGFEGELVYYVDESVSPENVCLMARVKSHS